MKKIGKEFDVNAALREAIEFETQNSFQSYMDSLIANPFRFDPAILRHNAKWPENRIAYLMTAICGRPQASPLTHLPRSLLMARSTASWLLPQGLSLLR